jgi:receptor protein-tyrosine kinase
MSLIEKAVNKLGGAQDAPSKPNAAEAPAANAAPANQPTNPIEEAVSRQASAMRAAEVPAEAPAHVAPSPAAGGASTVAINLARLKTGGFVTPDAERTEIAEEFRLIKRPLLINAFGQGADATPRGNMIMVTSSMAGEGKTFCTINLALSIAMEMDRTVLLVDADVAKPKLLQYLGVRAEKGLLDVLRDDSVGLPDVLLKTNIEKLTILPPGKSYKHATELLASDAMNSLIEDLASRYSDRIVIFDSPPLLATSEASVLASHMGQIVMVVEADKTPQAAVREALGQIEDSGAAISLLLNKTTGSKGGGYYGYGYGKYGT